MRNQALSGKCPSQRHSRVDRHDLLTPDYVHPVTLYGLSLSQPLSPGCFLAPGIPTVLLWPLAIPSSNIDVRCPFCLHLVNTFVSQQAAQDNTVGKSLKWPLPRRPYSALVHLDQIGATVFSPYSLLPLPAPPIASLWCLAVMVVGQNKTATETISIATEIEAVDS